MEVYIPSNGAIPLNTFQSEYKTSDAPIRLAYCDGNHYNAVIDPLLPTAGLGLGLPGLQPGLADKLQMEKAVQESDDFFMNKIARESHDLELKRAMEESRKTSSFYNNNHNHNRDCDYMLQKKQKAFSDLEETDFEFEQAALIRSLETYQRSEGSRKMPSAVGRGRGRGARGRMGGVAVGADAGNGSGSGTMNSTVNVNSTVNSTVNVNGYSHDMGMGDANFNSSTSTSTGGNHSYSSRSHLNSNSSPAVASLAVAASSSSAASTSSRREEEIPSHLLRQESGSSGSDFGFGLVGGDEYPQTVQELVMNGFELTKVLKAYDLIGNNFDHLLAFLMSTNE